MNLCPRENVMDRSPSGTSNVGRAFGARVHELYCTWTGALRDAAGDAAPCAKLEKHGQSMAWSKHACNMVCECRCAQGAGLALQRSCTVMQVTERRLFSMQLVFTCALMCAQEHGRGTFGRIPLPPDSGGPDAESKSSVKRKTKIQDSAIF